MSARAQGGPERLRREADLERSQRERLEQDWRLPMNERLARAHQLCKQMTAIAGAAKRR